MITFRNVKDLRKHDQSPCYGDSWKVYEGTDDESIVIGGMSGDHGIHLDVAWQKAGSPKEFYTSFGGGGSHYRQE